MTGWVDTRIIDGTRISGTDQPRDAFSVVILAGGLGTRLGGVDKAAISLGCETLVYRAVRRAAAWTDDILVVLRAEQVLEPGGTLPQSVQVVRDMNGYTGVLAGMAAGLQAANHDWSLVIACDMPFVQRELIELLWDRRGACEIVVPRLAVGLEPLHAFYRRPCLPLIRSALGQGQRRVTGFYSTLSVCYVNEADLEARAPCALSCFNINTPEDLARAQALLGASGDLSR